MKIDTTFLIVCLIFVLFLFYKFVLKPYLEKYDTTICYTGDLGAGKTNRAVTKSLKLFKKARAQVIRKNKFNSKLNVLIKKHNMRVKEYNNKHKYDKKPKERKTWEYKKIKKLPRLFSNIPVRIAKEHGQNKFSTKLTKEMFMLIVKSKDPKCPPIPEKSIVLVDELPQMIDQFNWDVKEVQTNVNEFITFFRHYFDGHLIITAQAKRLVVMQIRTKFSRYYWLSNMHKYFGLFYSVEILALTDIDENTVNMITDVDAQSKKVYGCFFPKRYDSRCYSERYPRDIEDAVYEEFTQFKTNDIIRFNKGESPLDPK